MSAWCVRRLRPRVLDMRLFGSAIFYLLVSESRVHRRENGRQHPSFNATIHPFTSWPQTSRTTLPRVSGKGSAYMERTQIPSGRALNRQKPASRSTAAELADARNHSRSHKLIRRIVRQRPLRCQGKRLVLSARKTVQRRSLYGLTCLSNSRVDSACGAQVVASRRWPDRPSGSGRRTRSPRR